MSKYEITVGQFRKFVEDTGYGTTAERQGWAFAYSSIFIFSVWSKEVGVNWLRPDFHQDDTHPVVCVSWYDAVAFCNWLSSRAGLEKVYDENTWKADFSKVGFRLPTEAEWEYAARAGGKKIKYPDDANYWGTGRDRWWHTSPVGSFPPNELGLYDMAGNVWEWCNDWYSANYYKVSPVDNPTGPLSGTFKVLRGGAWDNLPKECRSSRRHPKEPDCTYTSHGFRIVLPVR